MSNEYQNYTTNQFYKLPTSEGTATRRSDGTLDNYSFLWPSDHLKNANNQESRRVLRGYMRVLPEALLRGQETITDDFKSKFNTRLFFQFNPETITRSVVARNDIQRWENMDPVQLTQPIPGTANFSFELLFNREQEVASGRVKLIDGSTRFVGNNTGSVLTNTYVANNPALIGVLADLNRYDQIIGQGMNLDLVNAYARSAQLVREKEIAAQGENVDEEDKLKSITDEELPTLKDRLSINVGNSAFLVANPIRIMFSSLFMVEGYVTESNVIFDKFNPSMVPTQCRIQVSMQALYIGFAKDKTFITTTLADAINETLTPDELDDTTKKERDFLNDLGKKLWHDIAEFSSNHRGVVFRGRTNGVKDLTSNDDEGKQRNIKLGTTESLDRAAKSGKVRSIDGVATWKVWYLGNTNNGIDKTQFPKPATNPSNPEEYPKDIPIFQASSSVIMEQHDLNDQYEYVFPRPSNIPYNLDETETAKYREVIEVKFIINGETQTVDAEQKLIYDRTGKYFQQDMRISDFQRMYPKLAKKGD